MSVAKAPDILAQALEHRARGWSVIPLRHGTKMPLVPWERYQRELPGEQEIRGWLGLWPDANLAVVTGSVSGVVVLDVDPRHDGEASLESLEREHGPLPATVEAATGGGGRHFYFRPREAPVRTRIGIAPGLDLKGEGGVVVVPPSLHPSGRRYTWRRGHDPGRMAVAELPEWLLEGAPGTSARRGHPLPYWRDLVHAGVEEGSRNATLASLTGHLLWHGVDPDVALELLLAWNRLRCRPPLPDGEVARTVASIARTHAGRP